MIIGKYRVISQAAGWSFAVPLVYIPRTGLLKLISPWKKVWTGRGMSYIAATKLHPRSLHRWFSEAIEEYEAYQKAWAEHRGNQK